VIVNSLSDFDERRRRFVLYLLSSGALAAIPGCASPPAIHQAMATPAEMPPDSSVFSYTGELKVNGEIRQRSNTGQQIYRLDRTLTELSSIMDLYPGDLLLRAPLICPEFTSEKKSTEPTMALIFPVLFSMMTELNSAVADAMNRIS